jgi:hypothetical protein
LWQVPYRDGPHDGDDREDDTMTDPRPDHLRARLELRLSSVEGDEGIRALCVRAQEHVTGLRDFWLARDAPNGYRYLGIALDAAAKDCDSPDLRDRHIRLRYERASEDIASGSRQFDPNVCSKMMIAMIEELTSGDPVEMEMVIGRIAGTHGPLLRYGYDFIATLALVELLLARGAHVEAATATRRCLEAVSTCPISARRLYQALSGERSAEGIVVDAPEICLDDLSDRFCSQPFDTLATMSRSSRGGQSPDLFACTCPVTLPFRVNDSQETTVESVWNGPAIKEIRRSILDGDFTYCNRMSCHHLVKGTLPRRHEVVEPRLREIIDDRRLVVDTPPVSLSLSHDPSCNLACPQCRTGLITVKGAARSANDRFAESVLLPLMEGATITLVVCGDGDPFGSKHYRRLIYSLDPVRHSGVKLVLFTNGLLLTRREWSQLRHIRKLISVISVSIDAARKDTYEDLRRPGKWETIVENMEFLSCLRRSKQVPFLSANFVVQESNFLQMGAFVDLAKSWSADSVRFSRLTNAGTYTAIEFKERDVVNHRHPRHNEFLEALRDPRLKESVVDLCNLALVFSAETAGSGGN